MWQRYRRHPGALMSLATITLIGLACILAFLSPYDPEKSSIQARLQPPSREHLMGTDVLGRDVLTRILYGGRVSLMVGLGSTIAALLIGIPVGMFAGYYGGTITDSLLMRLTDMFLSFPPLFVLILLSAIVRDLENPFLQENQILVIILAISLISWMTIARIVRASFLSLREYDFILYARSAGADRSHIIIHHLLPNSASSIIVTATLSLPQAILIESGLSFIGLGIHPRTPTWGNMVGNSQGYMLSHPWVVFFPGAMIFISIIAINYLGDALRDALDPQKTIRNSSLS